VREYRNPALTVDVVIYDPERGVALIERANIPHGFALPGGFVDLGESVEDAAVREMREETGLDVELTGLLGVYSRPDRDPRGHTVSTVFTGRAKDPARLQAGDDARRAAFYPLASLPKEIVFDHAEILRDFMDAQAGLRPLAPVRKKGREGWK
jgi:8-oxo-dGTP diphosphatase